jgi:hypothetical protein
MKRHGDGNDGLLVSLLASISKKSRYKRAFLRKWEIGVKLDFHHAFEG